MRSYRLACVSALAFSACTCVAQSASDRSKGSDRELGFDTPSRIVSLLPAATEIILALDAGDRLVGRTSGDLMDSGLPDVGDPLMPGLERIATTTPDLVIVSPGVDLGAIRASVKILPMTIATLGDLRQAIGQLAAVMGQESRGTDLLAQLEKDLARARQIGAVADEPSVAWVVWHDPPTLAGAGTFMDEVLSIAGGENVVRAAEGEWPIIGFEALLDRDPDILVWPDGAGVLQPVHAPRLWMNLRAFRTGSIALVPANEYQVPGPSIGKSATDLAERFAELAGVKP